MPVRRIFLWTTPRCVSTAFEFSITTLESAKVFHEVFAPPFYSGLPLDSIPYPQLLPKSSFGEAKEKLLADYPGKCVVFAKEQAIYVNGKFDIFLEEGMRDFVHSFLIRDPLKSVTSAYRGHGSLERWLQFSHEGGFQELRDLYVFVREKIDPSPVVIDADDLLEDPEGVMKAYCGKVGIEYKEGMTRWEPGSMKTQDFIAQKGGMGNLRWNKAALRSSGLSKSVAANVSREEQKALPEEVLRNIEDLRPIYEELYKYRLVLDTKVAS